MNKILLCLILGVHCASLAYAQEPDNSTSTKSILKMNKKLYDQIVLALPETQSINIPKSLDEDINTFFSVHDKFHRTLILSGFCLLKIAKISLNSSFFPKPIKR